MALWQGDLGETFAELGSESRYSLIGLMLNKAEWRCVLFLGVEAKTILNGYAKDVTQALRDETGSRAV